MLLSQNDLLFIFIQEISYYNERKVSPGKLHKKKREAGVYDEYNEAER